MGKYASEIVKLAQSWLGRNEKDGTHKLIIDLYNSYKPLPKGYKLKYTDAWCAGTVAALSIKLGYTDIIPVECGCQRMIELFKQLGCWVENENRIPNVGDIIFYDWDDDGKGDNQGWADHVGIVERVYGNTITVIEGNYYNSVKRRDIAVNAKTIRGYGVPKYDKPVEEARVKMQTLKKGSTGNHVTIFETMMKELGYYKGSIDTSFGSKCESACNAFQKDYPECGTNGKPDGSFGPKCWKKLSSLFATK